jgi:methylated-DNA-[protein]-cysteine S-methyltransferase
MTPTTLTQTTIPSPLGPLRLLASEQALVGVYFPDHRAPSPKPAPTRRDHPILARAAAELDAYFAGRLRQFTIPLAPVGTEFQRAVWAALADIEYGVTQTYAELARRLGRPGAARAVGAANARNPISLVLPCHRVVGSGGALTGYAGGLARKRWLLAHEHALVCEARVPEVLHDLRDS